MNEKLYAAGSFALLARTAMFNKNAVNPNKDTPRANANTAASAGFSNTDIFRNQNPRHALFQARVI